MTLDQENGNAADLLRKDALLGMAEFAIKGTQLVATRHEDAVGTVGKVGVLPGSFSIVPGRADFSLDFRSASAETLRAMEKELQALGEDVASARGLTFGSKFVDATEPVAIPGRMQDRLAVVPAVRGMMEGPLINKSWLPHKPIMSTF